MDVRMWGCVGVRMSGCPNVSILRMCAWMYVYGCRVLMTYVAWYSQCFCFLVDLFAVCTSLPVFGQGVISYMEAAYCECLSIVRVLSGESALCFRNNA